MVNICNMELVAGITFLLLLISSADASSRFRNSPSVTSLHENYEASIDIWTIDAECSVRYTSYYSRSYQSSYSCYVFDTCYRTSYESVSEHKYHTHTCNSCWLSSNPGHFSIDSFTVKKIQCTDTKCGPTCSANGCLNGGETYYYTVTCEYTLGSYETTGQFSDTYELSATNANPPTFTYTEGSSIDVYKTTAGIGTIINTIDATVQDVGEPNDIDYITYVQNSGPDVSFIHATTDLFYLDTDTGEVKVGKSLDTEFSYYFTMNLCVKDRRHRQVCHDLSITLHACFQTPNCTDLTESNLHDTFSTYTGHDVGSDNVVFEMDYPQPGQHFVNFSTSWHDLTWTFDSNEFPEAAIDSDTGNIYITRNISIWPAWPTKHYSQRVRVSNSESCYTTTCDMSITVHYTNWPISIESLPATTSLHEDTDGRVNIHNLTTYDYNPDPEDNVTCVLVSVTPNEDNLFELVHNGNNTWDSYSIDKLACDTPDCGYKPANYLCDVGIGCMNHNLTQQYIITIKCDDGYNSSDTQSLTFNVNKNIAPTYTNVPNHLDLDRNVISHLDIVFSILYSDPENERLYYEYTYEDTSTSVDPGYFLGSTSGNYYNDMGNITMTVFLHDKEVNTTYRIHICGHERRNEICDDITIDIEEYCSEAPACTGGVISVTTEFTVGDEVFDISSLVTGPTSGGSYTSLSYAISGIQANYFEIDTSTGSVTTAKPLVTNFPTSTEKTYSLTGFVYDHGACGYGTCLLTVYVSAINYPVQIDNLPTTVSIHEDTLDIQTLYTLQISDDNSNDSYTCSILNTMDVEPFYLDQVPAGSGNYEFRNRQDYVLTTATLTYTATIFCKDIYGSNHTGEITIEVIENQPPSLTNLANPTTQNMNPLDYKLGDIVYVVRASDTENDDLIYSCQVATNYVPFECYQESSWNYAYIILRRNLHIYNDDGQTESIDVCVSDPKHYNASCGTLQVTFTLALTPPEITNLPTTEYIPEDTAGGYTIFTPVITDPDAGETHIVTVNVYPSSHSNKFRIDVTTGVLTLNGFLNYENVNYYEFVYRIRDNYLDGLTEKILAVNITNVNEGNTITADTTSVSFYENMTENTEFEDLGITCTDIDGDDVSISITPGTDSDHFGLNPITNRLSLTQSWDYETEAPSATLTITCTDGTLDSSVIILVAALDVNDNKPTLVTTFGDANTAIMINPNTPLSTIHVSVSATDVDAGNNGDFDFSIAGRGVGYEYFRMVPKSSRRKRSTGISEADLKLKKFADFTNHKSFPLTILACDTFGGIEQCGGLTFTVNFTAGNPDNKTKEETKCLTCTSTGRTYITILIIEGVIIVILILHFCYSIFCRRHEVVKLSDFDKTRNTRFNAKFNPAVTLNFKTPTVPMSRRSPVKPTHVIPIGKPQPSRRTQKHEDISTSESSSSSSDDDDRITEMTLRDRVERVRFNRGPPSTPASVGLPPPLPAPSFTGLPPAVYSSNVI